MDGWNHSTVIHPSRVIRCGVFGSDIHFSVIKLDDAISVPLASFVTLAVGWLCGRDWERDPLCHCLSP